MKVRNSKTLRTLRDSITFDSCFYTRVPMSRDTDSYNKGSYQGLVLGFFFGFLWSYYRARKNLNSTSPDWGVLFYDRTPFKGYSFWIIP